MSKPVFKSIRREDEEVDISCPMKVEIQVVSGAKLSEMPIFEKVVDRVVDAVVSQLKKEGFPGLSVTGLVRPITQEELLALMPRKKHLRRMPRRRGDPPRNPWLCSTPHVSVDNIVHNEDEVTCKLCLKALKDGV